MNIIWKVCYINGTKDFNHDLWNPDDIAFVIYHRFVTTELLQVLHTATYFIIITVRNEVAKVMFLQACVCPHGGVSASLHAGILHPLEQTPPWEQTPPDRHPQEQTPPGADTLPSPRDGHCCGRYASYWNVFLLLICLEFVHNN